MDVNWCFQCVCTGLLGLTEHVVGVFGEFGGAIQYKTFENCMKIAPEMTKWRAIPFAAPGIPRRSPIHVLTGTDVA